jgi:hypothetical protein
MRTRIDLDAAAVRLAARQSRWLGEGLAIAPTLWGYPTGWREDAAGPDAEHLMAEVGSPDWAVTLILVLDRDGWARVGFAAKNDEVWERRRLRGQDQWEALLDLAIARAPGMRVQHGQLVAQTCTTAPLDCVHGQLWIMPDCLVRIRGGLLTTVLQSYAAGTSARKAGRTLGYDPAAVLAAHRTNRVIPLDGIAAAGFRRGFATTTFTLDMADGTHRRLFWRTGEPAQRLLTDRLLPLLGSRLTI